MAIDQEKLHALLGRAVVDIGANFHAALVITGDKLGLFRALRELGPTTAVDLAKRTGTHERYVREWLSAMAAGGYVTYESAGEEFSLSEEQAVALLDADLPGAFMLAQATVKSEPRITDAFRTGKGVGWHEHDPALFEGTERFFRPGYAANLVADVDPGARRRRRPSSSGRPASPTSAAVTAPRRSSWRRRFPRRASWASTTTRARSSGRARSRSVKALADRVSFEVASAKDYPGSDYDLVAFFDCLHDMGDPVGVGRHVRSVARADGTWMLVEPFAHDRLEDNLNPVGRLLLRGVHDAAARRPRSRRRSARPSARRRARRA